MARIDGTPEADTLAGAAGDDVLTGLAGNDLIDGGAGTDIAVFAGKAADYRLGTESGFLLLTDLNPTDGNEGTDRLRSIETLRFSDGDIAVSAGGEIRLNTETFDDQARPALATGGGQSFAAWMSWDQDGDAWGVFAQRLDGSGSPVGGEFPVNIESADWQHLPAVAVAADGSALIVWVSDGQDGSDSGIYARRFSAPGEALGGEFPVNTETTSIQSRPAVTALAGGGYVVLWESFEQDGSADGVYGQRLAADGTPLGAEFRLNQVTAFGQLRAAVAGLADGGFVASWVSFRQDGSGDGVYARRYDAAGAAVGDEFPVNTVTSSDQTEPAIAALPDGGWVICWSSYVGSSWEILLQRFDAAGNRLGAETRVNSSTADTQLDATVTALADGGFVVSWMSFGQDGEGYGTYLQRFDASGAAVGGETLVNTRVAGSQTSPSVTALQDGGFLVAWTSSAGDGSGAGVFAQAFDAEGRAALPGVLGTDGADRFDLSGPGALQASGGKGDDVYVLGGSEDRVIERAGEGNDRIETPVAWVLAPGIEQLRLTGGEDVAGTGNVADNALWGNAGRNLLQGLGGADALDGGAGADTLAGGAGNDTLAGGEGEDTLIGGAGNDSYVLQDSGDTIVERSGGGTDTIRSSLSETRLPAQVENLVLIGSTALDGIGNAAPNRIDGSVVANLLDGGAGADTLVGGRGDDIYRVDSPGDRVVEQIGEGTDTVIGLVDHTLAAHVEQLKLAGSAAIDGTGNFLANLIEGNAAANRLDGGTGADVLIGGRGDDSYRVDQSADTVIEAAGEGFDTVVASADYALPEHVEVLRFEEAAGGSLGRRGTGNAASNRIEGGSGNDLLNGLGGDDTLLGAAGADTLVGGEGVDSLAGAEGDDVYQVDAAEDRVVEAADAGYDRVESFVAYTLGDNLEELRLLGSADIDGAGNALANDLIGNAGANRLFGDAGGDSLAGGAGLDTLAGGEGDDTYFIGFGESVVDLVVEEGAGSDASAPGPFAGTGSNIDTVISQVSYTLRANVENLQLAGSGNLSGAGNDGDNLLSGNGGSNALAGRGGRDLLDGDAGNDTLDGGSGNDTLGGGSGADVLAGGAGNDTLDGGSGADRFVFDTAPGTSNTDRISGFTPGTDKLVLDDDVFTAFAAASTVSNVQFLGAAGATAATTAAHRLVYDTASGTLYYDADGVGGTGAVAIAVLAGRPELAAGDFLVVG